MPKKLKAILEIDAVLSNLELILSGDFKDVPSYFRCNWITFGSGFSKFYKIRAKVKNPRLFPSEFCLSAISEEFKNVHTLVAREYLQCDGKVQFFSQILKNTQFN